MRTLEAGYNVRRDSQSRSQAPNGWVLVAMEPKHVAAMPHTTHLHGQKKKPVKRPIFTCLF